jgi:hypothetical protein
MITTNIFFGLGTRHITSSWVLQWTLFFYNFWCHFWYYFYLHRIYKMTQQATNFITTPSREMDEIFKLLAKHNMLQYIVHVLKWHPFPLFPQWTWYHNHKIYPKADWEVPNYNFILPFLWSIITWYIVDSWISKSKNLQWWLESRYKKLTNFPLIIMFFWHCKRQGVSNSLPILCCWPRITFASRFIGMEFPPYTNFEDG